MAQRLDGKGDYRFRSGTRRDGFFRLPKRPNGFHGQVALVEKPFGQPTTSELPRDLHDFIARMQERATRFDPFPTSWK